MIVYTFWCEYDLGLNDKIYKEESTLRKEVINALDSCGMEETLQELEDDGLFYVESQELGST